MTYWLDIFTPKSWQEFEKAGATVSGFPERRWKTVQSISVGDILVCYMAGQSRWFAALEVVSKAFRDEAPIWSDGLYPSRIKVKPLVVLEPSKGIPGKETLPKLRLFSGLKDARWWSAPLRTVPRTLDEKDGDFLLNELKKLVHGATPPDVSAEPEPRITHKQLIEMLCDMGKTLGFITKTEEETPDRAYRCDVTWRDYEAHSPIKVFEVELSRNIEHALSSLLHASHIWRPDQLYLIIADESDSARVEKLTERPLRGAFSEISRKLRAYPWSAVKKLHDGLSMSKDFIARLAER